MNMSDVFDRPTPDLQGRNDASATEAVSAALNLSVMKPSSRDARLPRPAIADAHGDELDLDSFRGDTTITCMPWPLIAVGQKVWLVVDGTLTDGSATTLPLLTAYGVTLSEVGNGLSEALPRTWLESLRNGSSISVTLGVSFDGSIDKVRSVEFPALNVTVRASEFNLVDDFEKYALGPLTDRQLDFLWDKGNIQSSWSIITAPSGLNGQCLRWFINANHRGYDNLNLTEAYAGLPVSVLEFNYILKSSVSSTMAFTLYTGSGYKTSRLIADGEPHTQRFEMQLTTLRYFIVGDAQLGPGTLDLCLDNLKIKAP